MTADENEAKGLADDLHVWRNAFAARMDAFDQRLAENTQSTKRVEDNTRELVDILKSWKGAMEVFEFLGKLAKPLAAIGLAFGAWFTWKGRP